MGAKKKLLAMDLSAGRERTDFYQEVKTILEDAGYNLVDVDERRPWGAYYRISGEQADEFLDEFFMGLSAEEARMGNARAEISPKILVIAPEQRNSWQYHHRRAERWHFLTGGAAYHKSMGDEPGEPVLADAGLVVQFAEGERHRVVSRGNYVLVAEIWQHIDAENPSDEFDIVRLADDYSR